MAHTLVRVAAAAGLGGILLLAGCSSQPVRRATSASSGRTPSTALPITGIPACDAYLASYLACHRAGGTYPPDQLLSRYRTMRDTLLREARDPAVRPYLGRRCASMSDNLRGALHGRSCAALPVAGNGVP